MTDQASEAAPPTPWTPAIGQVLKHRTSSQSLEITGMRNIDGLPTFWEVRLHKEYGAPKPWLIVETALVNQYELRK